MAFTGSLEDLSVIDIIQLIHVSKKSGTVVLESFEKKASIAFKDGDIIGVSHPQTDMNTGYILLEMGAVTKPQLLEASRRQQSTGESRKPIVATLIDMGHLDEETGWNALAKLVQDTIIEVVSWQKGSFSYELDDVTIFDDFKYFPPEIIAEPTFDTQNLLLDAMRILDESAARDTTPPAAPDTATHPPHGDQHDSDDENERPTAPPKPESAEQILADMTESEEQKLLDSIDRSIDQVVFEKDLEFRKAVLWSTDPELKEMLEEICLIDRVDLCVATNEEHALDQAKYWMGDNKFPVVIIDMIDWESQMATTDDTHSLIRQLRRRFPEVPIIALGPKDPEFVADAYSLGARVVLSRPRFSSLSSTRGDMEHFPKTFAACLSNFLGQHDVLLRQLLQERKQMASLKNRVHEIVRRDGYQDVTLVVLKYVAEYLARCVIFLVRKEDLLALGSFGVNDDHRDLSRLLMRVEMPQKDSIIREVIKDGIFFLGDAEHDQFSQCLYDNFNAPENPEVILFPLRVEGKTIAVIYGDFGMNPTSRIQTDALEILANNAGLALSLELAKKASEKKLQA